MGADCPIDEILIFASVPSIPVDAFIKLSGKRGKIKPKRTERPSNQQEMHPLQEPKRFPISIEFQLRLIGSKVSG